MRNKDELMLLSNNELKEEMEKLEATYKTKQDDLRIVLENMEKIDLELRELSNDYISIRNIYDKRNGNKN
nr:MAG TPA: hypothetical protein [Caudoviricetes sp.]